MLQRHAARYAELGTAEQFRLTMMSITQVWLSLLPVATPAHCMQEGQLFGILWSLVVIFLILGKVSGLIRADG